MKTLVPYICLALAFGGACVSTADAALLVSDFSSSPYTLPVGTEYLSFTLDGQVMQGYSPVAHFLIGYQSSDPGHVFLWPISVDGGVVSELESSPETVDKLDTGVTIDLSSNFSTGPYLTIAGQGDWTEGGTGIVGLRWEDNVGWAEISYDPAGLVTLHRVGYDNSGAAVQAPPVSVPEPTTAFLGVIAAACVLRRRRAA